LTQKSNKIAKNIVSLKSEIKLIQGLKFNILGKAKHKIMFSVCLNVSQS